MTKKCARCGVEFNKVSGRYRKIRTPIVAIIRTLDVCNRCFNIIRRDNKRLISRGEEIPSNVDGVKELW